jgi:serine/threonine protein kinase
VQNQNFQTKQNPNQPPQSPNPVPFTFTGRAPRQGENLIPSAWAKTVNLANLDRCKLEIPNANSTDALKGGNGQLGFIKSPDPKSPIVPPLVMKISLDASKTSELENERNAYEKLGDNPRFLKCLGLAVVGGQRGLVMERVNGTDMKKTLEAFKTGYESGDVSHEEFWGTVQFTLRETIRGLQDLEQAGIVHHDIAPDNLICDRATGNVKIFDFGSATGERHQGGVNLPIGKGMVSPDYITKDSYGDPKMDPEGITPKHDAFGAGQIAYQAGEKDIFRYHDQSGNTPNLNALLAFKTMAFADSESDEDEEDESAANQAIRPADSANPAFTPLPKSEENKKAGQFAGTPKHVPGRKGASTRYTEFVNKLMHPDPTKRMSLADALKHPFLSDSLMTDEQAKQFLVLNMPGVRPRLGGG